MYNSYNQLMNVQISYRSFRIIIGVLKMKPNIVSFYATDTEIDYYQVTKVGGWWFVWLNR
jgi:hypothetical protein